MSFSHPERSYNACGHLVDQSRTRTIAANLLSDLEFDTLIVDVVDQVGEFYTLSMATDRHWHNLRQYFIDLHSYLAQSTMYSPLEKIEAEWRTPIADIQYTASNREYARAPEQSHMSVGYMRAKEVHGWSSNGTPQSNLAETLQAFYSFTETPEALYSSDSPYACYIMQLERMYNTRPFLSHKGYVGLCPPETEPGDTIAVFAGVKLPYIIRLNTNGSTWKLIGEAYVHGIMDGEYVSSRSQTEMITLH
jgi:hypothetical protein